MAICADVSDGQAVGAMFEKIGPVDLLVNNAGVAVYGLLTDLDPAVWQRLFDVNVTGMYNCCRCAIPPMVHEKAGHIINLASILGTNGASCEVAYSGHEGRGRRLHEGAGKGARPVRHPRQLRRPPAASTRT